jgi:hypothetical protein
MRHSLATLVLGAAILLSPPAFGDAPRWVDRHVVPNVPLAGSFDLGFGVASRDTYGPRGERSAGLGFNLEGAVSLARRIELGLRIGLRTPVDGRDAPNYDHPDAFARPFDGNTLYDLSNGGDTIANPELRVRGKLVETRAFELALEGRGFLPTGAGTRFTTLLSAPMQAHTGLFRADINPGLVVGFYDPAWGGTRFIFSMPVNLWFQVTPKVWLGPLTGFRIYDHGYDNVSYDRRSSFDLIFGFGLGVSVTPFLDIKTQLLFPRINTGADWFGAGVALGFVFDPS